VETVTCSASRPPPKWLEQLDGVKKSKKKAADKHARVSGGVMDGRCGDVIASWALAAVTCLDVVRQRIVIRWSNVWHKCLQRISRSTQITFLHPPLPRNDAMPVPPQPSFAGGRALSQMWAP